MAVAFCKECGAGLTRYKINNCGETVCPNDAVSIDITDLRCVDEQIKKLESHVQVS